jgi:DNA-binding transcriptional ArsR family regulator
VHAFDVLGDPVRRRILELLADGEVSAGAVGATIQDEFAITQPAVSQHLKVLRDNGFASVRADGQRRLYAVDGTGLRDVDEWLDGFRRFWTPRLSVGGPGRRNHPDARPGEQLHRHLGVGGNVSWRIDA